MRSCTLWAATALLAGCGSQSANQPAVNASGSGGATAAAPAGGSGTISIQPGAWEVTVQTRMAAAAGLPPGVHLPQIPPSTVRTCVTPEQVARTNGSFLSGSSHRPGVDCDYSRVTVAGGRIQGTSSCTGSGMQATVTMDGSFTPTSYDVDQQMQASMRGRSTSSTTHLSGRRVGDCAPGEAEAAEARHAGQ